MSPTRVITIEKQDLAPAREVAQTAAGLKLQVAYGEFFETSQLANVDGWKESTLTGLNELTRIEPYSTSMRHYKQYAAIASGYVRIPGDGVYFFSSDNEEVWIDGKLLVDNKGEVKRFSRRDKSVALAQGLHEIKVVFLGHIIGGWPSNWGNGSVSLRKADAADFARITPDMLVH
jgi:hexosaminidase